MDKNSLYRFFEGQASIEEMRAVKEWAESSEEHSTVSPRAQVIQCNDSYRKP